jgi:protoporphyrin/coproporphyrin ferrochelatase
MGNKTAIILLNLGGPHNLKEVKGFLFNLFYDKAIINLPNPFRYLLAKFISARREKKSQNIYASIGNKSPIYDNSLMQANAIEENLAKHGDYKVFIAMRYASPRVSDIINLVREYSPNETYLVPLYPQYSTTTTESSIKEFNQIAPDLNAKYICCYPVEENFIKSHCDIIQQAILEKNIKDIRVIFTAHGLPEKKIKEGDPYQWQVQQTVDAVVKKLDIKDLDYLISYQSKVGPLKWLGPNTEDEIIKASKDNKIIVVVPIAFVSDHSETLYELDMEYKEVAEEHNCMEYIRVASLGVHKYFIDSITSQILNYDDKRICPKEFCKCIRRGDNG